MNYFHLLRNQRKRKNKFLFKSNLTNRVVFKMHAIKYKEFMIPKNDFMEALRAKPSSWWHIIRMSLFGFILFPIRLLIMIPIFFLMIIISNISLWLAPKKYVFYLTIETTVLTHLSQKSKVQF